MTFPAHRLGKKAPRHNDRTPFLAAFLNTFLPHYPKQINWGDKVDQWPMLGNDLAGDCTIVGAMHADMTWTANAASAVFPFSTEEALAAYARVTGLEGHAYDPQTGRNDNGAVEDDVLALWRDEGIGSRKIAGWADINPNDLDSIRYAIATFGGVYVGIALPLSAYDQLTKRQTWSVTSRHDRRGLPGSWGGHCMFLNAYSEHGFSGPTWGQVQLMTVGFALHYLDEVHVPVSEDWMEQSSGVSPSDLNWASLLNALKELGPVH